MGVVTLSGDRQTGKTHAVLAIAGLDATVGRFVVYQGFDLQYASYIQDRLLEDVIPPTEVAKVCRAHGQGRILTRRGGEIRFKSHRMRAGRPTPPVDTYILDDWASAWIPDEVLKARHVYVAHMADDA